MSTGLTGHDDSYPLEKQRTPIPLNRGDCDQKNAKYYARRLDQSTSRWPGKTLSMEPPRSRPRLAPRVLMLDMLQHIKHQIHSLPYPKVGNLQMQSNMLGDSPVAGLRDSPVAGL